MKKLILTAIIASLSVFNTSIFAQSQPDNQAVEPDSSVSSFAQKYRHITRKMVEGTSMFRIGLNQLGYNNTTGLHIGYRVAYERKISVPISLVASAGHQANGWNDNSFGVGVAVRYYYAQQRQIKRGKGANNLSANYFSLLGGSSWFTFQDFDLNNNGAVVLLDRRLVRSSSVALVYGLQRRIGKYLFADFNLGYSYRLTSPLVDRMRNISFVSNFTIGLAI